MPKKTDAPLALERNNADELLYKSLRSIYHFERSLAERFGLGFEGIYLLQLLRRRESACIGEIAAALDLQVFSTTRLVQRLEAAGLVNKERNPDDRRTVTVRLEPAGERLVSAIEAHNFELIVGSTTRLSKTEQNAFVLVAKNLEQVLGVEDKVARD